MQFYCSPEIWQTLELVVIIHLLPLNQLLKYLFDMLHQCKCVLPDKLTLSFLFSFNFSKEQLKGRLVAGVR